MVELKIDTIRRLINDRENKNVDFKLQVDFTIPQQRVGLAKDVVAFSNAEGGTIIVGIEDKTRDIKGIKSPLDHDQIVQSITDLTDPPVDISVDSVKIDGVLIGIITIPRGKMVHQLRQDRTIYLRRDGVNSKATPDEIILISDEREYSSRVYLSEPEKFFSIDNTLFMLTGEELPYRKIEKRGGLRQLAESPVFLPEFSRWTSAPEFGNTKGSLMVSYPNFGYLKHKEFVEQISKVETQLNALSRYLDLGAQTILHWSISSYGALCYGCGSDTLLKALDDGELGVISIVACGDFRGSDQRRSFFLLICGYCKSKEGDMTLVQDREVRLYLSTIPFSTGWFRVLFSPFLDEDKIPFSTLSYELVHPRLRVWHSMIRPRLVVPIRGVVGRYKYLSIHEPMIGAAIADTKWFNPNLYVITNEWKRADVERDPFSDTIFERIKNEREINECPVELMNECVVSLTNPVPSYDDIASRETTGFYLPLIKHLELEVTGHTVHVLGLNASPK